MAMTSRQAIAAAVVLLLAGAATIAAMRGSPSGGPDAPHVVRIGAMMVERAAHQATRLPDGQVLITGGCGGHGCDSVVASTELYDPATRSFQAAAAMGTPRAGHAAVALPDGRVLVCGGWTGDQATATAEIYDPQTGQWTGAGGMTAARASQIVAALPDGRVLVVGGGSGRLGDLATAEVFDPATEAFSAVGPMHANHYLATTMADGRVLMTGGQDAEGRISSSAEIFDPVTGEFQRTGAMRISRVKHAAVPLADDRVLILGGSDERGYAGRYTSTEIYDPQTGTFSPGPEMHHGRHKIRDAVVVLPSGAVLVAGGALPPEILDPGGEAFQPVEGELSGPQMFATATLLTSGEVLVLGGYDDRTRASASAWLVVVGR
jgi:hypothetical protein